MIRRIIPTIIAVVIMIRAERIMSGIPSSLIITTKVAIQGKNMVSMVAIITSCNAENVPAGKLSRVPTARSFLRNPLMRTIEVSPGRPKRVVMMGWKRLAR